MPCKWYRGVAERLNAAVLKTVILKGIGGSNPSSSAKVVTIRKNDGTDAKYEMETFAKSYKGVNEIQTVQPL